MSSSSEGTNKYDLLYNQQMASIAKDQQDIAEEYFQYWKSGPGHWEYEEQSTLDKLLGRKAEKTWVADEGGVSYQALEQEEMKANLSLIPQQTELAKSQMGLESAQIDEQMKNIEYRSGVSEKYYDEVMNGVDIDEKVGLARADVEQAYSGAEANARRWASSLGINPASKKYGAGLMSLAKEKAAAKVGATSLARRTAEEENFARLSGAMGLASA